MTMLSKAHKEKGMEIVLPRFRPGVVRVSLFIRDFKENELGRISHSAGCDCASSSMESGCFWILYLE